MGEAKQRKLAGTYPRVTTKAEDDAIMAELYSRAQPEPLDPRIELFLLGHEVELTEELKQQTYDYLANNPPFRL